MKYFYGVLCVIGIFLPYGALAPWLADQGLNIGLLVSEAAGSKIGAFAWLDVLISAIALLGFIWAEGIKRGMKKLWLPTLGTFVVGVSLGLPLFLLMRELHIEHQES